MSQLSAAEEARIKSAFECLKKGDVITSENFSLVVIRFVNARAVIGMICAVCEKRHVGQVFRETFSWSDEKKALVDNHGDEAEWWSTDLQIVHEDDVALAEESEEFPVDDDYHLLAKDKASELHEKNEELLLSCLKILSVCDSRKAAMRRALELIGVQLTDEKADLLFIVLAMDNKLHNRSHVSGLLGVLLTAKMADSESSHMKH